MAILNLKLIIEGKDLVTEHQLRSIVTHAAWDFRRDKWKILFPFSLKYP